MAELGLSSSMQDLSVVTYGLLATACGIQFPDQGLNLGPLHWEHGVLAIGLPVKSQDMFHDITQGVSQPPRISVLAPGLSWNSLGPSDPGSC